jgi:GTP-binding protein Era
MSIFKSGYVTVIGVPNVGKSTLLNKIIGEKVVITSEKPQTTRNVIRAMFNRDDCQIIFVDTPGIHYYANVYNQHMTKMAMKSLSDIDLIYHMVDAGDFENEENKKIYETLKQTKTPAFLIINKMDLLNREEQLETIDRYSKLGDYEEYIPISALTDLNMDDLIQTTLKYLPEGQPYFPSDILTDKNERFVVSELIREKVLQLVHQEVPHSIAVIVEEFKERPNNIIYILATIYVEHDSQKGIIIGNNGQMLKKIGQLAREDIEGLLGCKVYLELYTKVRKNWRKNINDLKEFGYFDR